MLKVTFRSTNWVNSACDAITCSISSWSNVIFVVNSFFHLYDVCPIITRRFEYLRKSFHYNYVSYDIFVMAIRTNPRYFMSYELEVCNHYVYAFKAQRKEVVSDHNTIFLIFKHYGGFCKVRLLFEVPVLIVIKSTFWKIHWKNYRVHLNFSRLQLKEWKLSLLQLEIL